MKLNYKVICFCMFIAKIRRLYDIANILTSLNLIRKVHVTEIRGRKPAFKYIGPDIDQNKDLQLGMLRRFHSHLGCAFLPCEEAILLSCSQSVDMPDMSNKKCFGRTKLIKCILIIFRTSLRWSLLKTALQNADYSTWVHAWNIFQWDAWGVFQKSSFDWNKLVHATLDPKHTLDLLFMHYILPTGALFYHGNTEHTWFCLSSNNKLKCFPHKLG